MRKGKEGKEGRWKETERGRAGAAAGYLTLLGRDCVSAGSPVETE